MFFNPCIDQQYQGISHLCTGPCSICVFKQAKQECLELRQENAKLKSRIEEELEPRLKQEKRSYDAYVTNAEIGG